MSGLQSVPSYSRMMTSFSGCASLMAVLSAFENLKARYNTLKKENKHLRSKITRYENTQHESVPLNNKNQERKILPDHKITPTHSDNVSKTAPREHEDVLPTVQTIVSKINDQLIIIGHQLDSLLQDFDRIDTKDEIYKVQETVSAFILPRLINIRHKELESIYEKDQDTNSPRSVDKSDEDYLKSDQGEVVTDNLLKLQRLLRKQNVMLKNLACFINEGGGDHLLFTPPDGWSLVGKS